jgi:hypothetical protein
MPGEDPLEAGEVGQAQVVAERLGPVGLEPVVGEATAGSHALADRAAPSSDDPGVDARPVGVNPDGVAAVAGHPEFVARVLLVLVLHSCHPEIVTLRPTTGDRRFRGCASRWS